MVTKPNPNYFFLKFVNPFKRSETIKLIIDTTIARITVSAMSSETMLGTTLNKAPDAVPVRDPFFDFGPSNSKDRLRS